MAFINGNPNWIDCRVVYWGPGFAGRTTNLQYIHAHTNPDARPELVFVADAGRHVLSLWLGELRGHKLRLHLHTGPGAVVDDVALMRVVRGIDGVVFVADSQEARMEANLYWLEQLAASLASAGLAIDRVPLVFQYNKRDVPGALPVAELDAALNPGKRPAFEAVATTGVGVLETLRAASKLVLPR